MEKYQFIIWYSAFAFFIVQMTALTATSILNIDLQPPPISTRNARQFDIFPYFWNDNGGLMDHSQS